MFVFSFSFDVKLTVSHVGNVFYDYEFLDIVAKFVIRFDPMIESLDYLRDLVCDFSHSFFHCRHTYFSNRRFT